MELILMRHGKAELRSDAKPDFERELTSIGRKKIMIPRPSRGYFFNGRSPSLLATPKGRTHGLPLAMKLLLATRKRVFNVEG